VITTTNLSKRFGDLTAVDQLNLTIPDGELFGLVGSDGAGKTTTLRMLAGIMDPSGGSATVLGRDTVREAESIKGESGYMSQRFGLYPDLTVQENILFFADMYGVSGHLQGERIDRLLAFSNLAPFKKRQAGNLSGGMKQKLGLACALIHKPRLLLLDEPTNGVDPVSRRDFWRILLDLQREGTTIMITTAYLDEAERCQRVGFMHGGRLLACDTPLALRQQVPGAILEVRTTQGRRAARHLRGALPDCGITLFGDRLHLATLNSDQDTPRIAAALQAQGIELLGMRQVEPSMEDVFVALLGEQDGGATTAGDQA
jgi:ABC-2 type transport system ATP-binding protein